MLKSLDFPGRYLYVVAMRIYPWDGRILGLQRQMRKRNSNLRVDDLTKPRDRHKSENMAAIHSALHKSFTETFIPTLTCSAVTCRWALIYLLTSLSRRQQVYQPSYKDDFRCMTVAAAWWLGNIRESAITTFSLLPAVNTTTSAMSSGVKGSTPL